MKVKDLLAILGTVPNDLEVNFCMNAVKDTVSLSSIEVIDVSNYKISYTDITKITKDKEIEESKICFILTK